ncbi:MAG: enoyl-CoA hydratase-related protein [Candidatus Sericytochromatia bacterium]
MNNKEFENIEFKVENSVAEIILNRPNALNALNAALTAELKKALDLCANDEVKAVILSGNGKGFSSGGDIKMMSQLDTNPKLLSDLLENLHNVIIQMRNLEKPIIAAIGGFAFGAGFSLALACDFRIGGNSSLYSCAFVNIGLVPDSGASFFLTKLVGYAKATELMMLGNTIDSKMAMQMGLLNGLVKDEDVLEEARKLGSLLAKKPSSSLSRIKRMVNKAIISDLPDQLGLEAMYQSEVAKSDNFREGITAFLQKREANFN